MHVIRFPNDSQLVGFSNISRPHSRSREGRLRVTNALIPEEYFSGLGFLPSETYASQNTNAELVQEPPTPGVTQLDKDLAEQRPTRVPPCIDRSRCVRARSATSSESPPGYELRRHSVEWS